MLQSHSQTFWKIVPNQWQRSFWEVPDLPRRLAFLLNKKAPLPNGVRIHLTRALALLASREASRVSVKESGAPEALWSLLENSALAKGASIGIAEFGIGSERPRQIGKERLDSTFGAIIASPGGCSFCSRCFGQLDSWF